MQNIFISYRRDDAIDVTGRITHVLKGKLGEGVLFKDIDSIPLGADFRRVIADAVGRCDVLLAIIGDEWLDATHGGRSYSTVQARSRRIDDPNDYVHIEIRAALERDIPVIPVLVERTNMPQDKDLPEPLRPLAFRNAISVRPDPDFHNDMQRLCHALSGVVHPDPKPSERPSRSHVVLAARIVMLALGAAAVFFVAVYFRTAVKQLQPVAPKAPAEEQTTKTGSEEAARQEAERLSREKAAAEARPAKARSKEVARQEAERLSREKAAAEEQAAKARSEEVARQEAERFAAAKAELLASQERLLQIAIANASWEAADELSTKLLQGGLPADRLRGYLQAIAKGRMEAESLPTESIPKFPWPPPRASAEYQIRNKWVSEGAQTTLRDVAEKLEAALEDAGFGTWKYSSVPNGFALVSQVEQISPDGTPRKERFRTDVPSFGDLSFVEFLIALAKAPPGYYRVIVFIVTDTPFSQKGAEPTENEARRWLDEGANKLPKSLGEPIYGKDYRTTALIYQFKKLSKEPATLVSPSLASGRSHLERAGIWNALTR